MSTITKEQVNAALQLTLVLAQAIHAAGPEGIPSGHLYARVMGHMDLATYQRAIALLKNKGLVSEEGHLLTSTLHAKT